MSVFGLSGKDSGEIKSEEEGDVENCLHKSDFIPSAKLNETAIFRQPFPFLRSAEVSFHYKSSQKRHLDVVSVAPLAFLYYCNVFVRFNLSNLGQGLAFNVCAFVLLVVLTVIFIMFFVSHAIMYSTKEEDQDCFSYQLSERCLVKWFGGRIEDILGFLCALTVGINFTGRVRQGQCDADITIWAAQSCNPYADAKSIPMEEVFVLYLIPMGCQIVMRGLSSEALILCWMTSISFTLYAIAFVEAWLECWVVIYSLGYMVLSFEVERYLRQAYVQSKAVLAASTEVLQLEADARIHHLSSLHKVELLKVTAENDQKLRESESMQLRSLMGNVAHDLKTPLHSIEADVDVLRAFFYRIPSHILTSLAVEFQTTCAGEIMDPESVFNSLNATCKFMGMAINRSQDFMKASSNIALNPAMETFEFETALSMSVTCINHLQTSRSIIVHPYDTRISANLISDRHWLSENVLCLLSNAIKYSDDGVIDVRVELVEAAAFDMTSQKRSIARHIVGRKLNSTSDSDCESADDNEIGSGRETVNSEAVQLAQRMVLLTVEDSGIGISKSMRKTLFQPFKQAQRMAGGTGLGLYSLSKRTEALGGSCGVSSRSDGERGSMFWFAFPYRPDTTADVIVEADITDGCRTPTTTASDQEQFVEPLRILVVDDSISVLKVTSRLLKMNGHTVETASNGFVGLERLKKCYETRDFDLVLTDLQMPVMDGIEAVKRFRAFEEESGAPTSNPLSAPTWRSPGSRLMFVGMSANADDESKQEALEAGMDDFITKPFAYRDLAKILIRHSDKKDRDASVALLSSLECDSEDSKSDCFRDAD